MRVLVVGAGAIGSVLGGFLAHAGHQVTLLGRAWHLDVVRRDGLAISGIWGEHRVECLATATAPEAVAEPGAFDWLFLCTKAHQTAEAAALLPRFLGPRTLVCAFQNGLGNYETIIRHVPPAKQRVALGRVIFGVEIEPGRVRVTVCADQTLIGDPGGGCPSARLEALASALRESGVPAGTTPRIMTVLWGKAIYNCALNGLSTLLRVPYGRLPESAAARYLMREIVEETYRVATAHRIALEPETAEGYWRLLTERLIPDTAAHRSSMLQDIERRRRTEIEALNGAIVRLAQESGLEAPANALVADLVRAAEHFAGVAH